MIHPEINAWSDAAGMRYQHFADRLVLIRDQALNSDLGIDQAIGLVRSQGAQAFAAFQLAEQELIVGQLSRIAESALQTRSLAGYVFAHDESVDALGVLVEASAGYFLTAMTTQALRDVAQIKTEVQSVILQAGNIARLQRVDARTARLSVMRSLPEPRFQDRLGRTMPVARHARNIARMTMLSVQNEAVLFALGLAGERTAVVRKIDDTGLIVDVNRIKLDGLGALPSYFEIRERILHPNSRAWIDPETAHVHA